MFTFSIRPTPPKIPLLRSAPPGTGHTTMLESISVTGSFDDNKRAILKLIFWDYHAVKHLTFHVVGPPQPQPLPISVLSIPFEIHELVLACRDQNWTPSDEAQELELLEFCRDWNDGHETLCSITLDDGGGFITALSAVLWGKDTSDLLPRLKAHMHYIQRLDLECHRIHMANDNYSVMDTLRAILENFPALTCL